MSSKWRRNLAGLYAAVSLAASASLAGCNSEPPARPDGSGSDGAGSSYPDGSGLEASMPGNGPAVPDGAAQDAGAVDAAARDAMARDTGMADARTPDASGDGGGSGAERCVNRAPVDATRWKLAWSDEFDHDGAPSSADWGFESGFVRNQELQWYQAANASIANGLLTIAGRRERIPNPQYVPKSQDWKKSRQFADYTSTSMTTSGKHSFTYGRFEMCGRIDTRAGSWPAFWTLGSGVGWPQSGEVDVMEYYANKVLANVCKPSGNTCAWSSMTQSVASLGGATWTSAFHLWTMQWDAQTIDLFLDDKLVNHFDVTTAVPSGQTNPYVGKAAYVLVNLAIGGANGGDPSSTQFPLTYEMDYVRVYQHR